MIRVDDMWEEKGQGLGGREEDWKCLVHHHFMGVLAVWDTRAMHGDRHHHSHGALTGQSRGYSGAAAGSNGRRERRGLCVAPVCRVGISLTDRSRAVSA